MSSFICPVCKSEISLFERTYKCNNNHCFDLSKDGYVNLLMSQQSSSKRHGDDKLMVKARRDFLDTGAYLPLAEKLVKLAKRHFCGTRILDIGCGEGYYTDHILRALSNEQVELSAFDISRDAVKLAAKRNHINAFMADGEWHTEKILPHHCKMLVDFNKKWCDGRCQDKYLQMEICAARRGLENFESLGFLGLMLYKNGALVAYSYGEPINRDTFCVHVEKADSEVRGAYQMINREFAREYCTDYKLINREDDAGDEGLRRAKLSYYPTQAGRKFRAIIK